MREKRGLDINGRRAWCPATFISMLLDGGCGYEDGMAGLEQGEVGIYVVLLVLPLS
jgi:hypothetical protein